MTLTIPDIENWNPAALGKAGTGIDQLSTHLDDKLKTTVTRTHDLKWDGAAAKSASDRIDVEKTRASAVSQALQQLKTALSQQIDNLDHTKDAVLRLRNIAQTPPGPGIPAFAVEPDGTVNPSARIAWLRQSLKGPHGEDLSPPGKLDEEILKENIDALNQQVAIQHALGEADKVATAAITAVDTAREAVDAAYNGLGDPNLGLPSSAPVPTAPTAVSAPPAAPGNHTSGNWTPAGPTSGSPTGGSPGPDQTVSFSGPASGGPPGAMPTGDKAKWIQQALEVLRGMGYDTSDPQLVADISAIISHESGDDPHAYNGWDSNAAAGHPSKGLMQTIDSTFNAYKAPGHDDIWNPVDNIVAGVRYSVARYGSVHDVPGLGAMREGGAYQGY